MDQQRLGLAALHQSWKAATGRRCAGLAQKRGGGADIALGKRLCPPLHVARGRG
ncbi:MAG: hypothetical protein HPM95_13195 [Alphaproteobacteria bacterium]|nr:hypothetical protein [Alphaproteobacteria bacterium]